MKRFASAILIICLLCAGLFIVYSFEIKPVESLIRPPEYSDEGGSVQAALEAEIGKMYFLKTPTKGEHTSAFVYEDLDGDGKKEAVVLYSDIKYPNSVNICIYKKEESVWKRLASVSSPYSDVVQIDFADISGSGVSDIVVGCSSYSSEIVQHLFVYAIDCIDSSATSVNVRYECDYSQYCVLDVDRDKKSELLVLNSNDNEQAYGYTADIISFSSENSSKKDSVLLDSALRIVSDISYDFETSESGARMYIDGYTSDGKMLTDMIIWDEKKNNLTRKKIGGKSVAALTTRTKTAVCEDIDSDGIMDIPTDYILPASKSATSQGDKNIILLHYVSVSGNKLKNAGFYFENTNNGYYYKIDKSVLKKITIVTSQDASSAKFYTVNETKSGKTTADRLVFEIRTVTDLETGRAPQTFKSLGQNKEFYYYCRIYEKGEDAGLTISDIRDNLIFDLKGSSK
ncbi:MAG: FG-GAP repeat domain-containing protein [Acutalibacteraceae bacterium]